MKSKKAWISGGIILLVIIAASAILLGRAETVEVVEAGRGTLTLLLEEAAYVQARDEREVQATVPAQVEELLVAAGDKVILGQLLMKLSSPELSVETASARSQLLRLDAELQAAGIKIESIKPTLNQAENDLARKKNLLQSGALAPSEYEKAELEVEGLKNTLSQQESLISSLKQQLVNMKEMLSSLEAKQAQLQVISPMAGVILDLPVKTGQVVALGTLLARLGSPAQLEVKTELLSDEAGRVKLGQKTRITAPVLGEEVINGQVSKIYPQAYEKISALGIIQRRVPVIITLEQVANLKPGYEVRVAIETLRKEGAILLPRESLRLDEDGQYRVLLVKEERIEECLPQLGEKNQQWVEIITGIEVGETVVRDGSLDLKEGQRVKTLKAN